MLSKLFGRTRFRTVLWLAISLLLTTGVSLMLPSPKAALAASGKSRVLVPGANYENIDFYLITIGLGDDIYTRFGHTIIRVRDRATKQDESFNWGLFDFDKPNFAWNFFKGHLDYHLGVNRTSTIIQLYRNRERRSAFQEPIQLTLEQKKRLGQMMLDNLKPENRFYRYQYFHNNCATRPRDLLDQALGGQLSKRMRSAMTSTDYRYWVRKNLATMPLIVMSLDIAMNSDIDHELSEWDLAFLPSALRTSLQDMPAFDDESQPIEGQKLLGPSIELMGFPERPVPYLDAYAWVILVFGVSTVWSMIWLTRWQRQTSSALVKDSNKGQIRANKPGWPARFFGFHLLVFGLFCSIFGSIMTLSWYISEHTDLHGNWNLLLFFPVDIVFACIGMALLVYGRMDVFANARWPRLYVYFYMARAIAALLLFSAGFIDQDLSQPLFYLFPIAAVILTTYHRGRQEALGRS